MSEVKRFRIGAGYSIPGQIAGYSEGFDVVPAADYDALLAENEALKAERPELITARLERDELRAELEAVCSKVAVMPERWMVRPEMSRLPRRWAIGWNACLDELSRLNGKTVSEGLLRGVLDYADSLLADVNGLLQYAGSTGEERNHEDADYRELRALLDEGKGATHG
ncbi:hypothetical protein D3C78_549310 [compost metagenome]